MSTPTPQVTILSKLTVVPCRPVRPGRKYPLSLLDHAMSLHTLHLVFYYHHNRSDIAESFDLGRLREAFSEALSYFPPVTGRLGRDECGNWEVKCNDAGVRMVKAKVDCSLDEWLRFGDEKDLTVWEDLPEDTQFWSPYLIQEILMNDEIVGDFTRQQGGALSIQKKSLADPEAEAAMVWADELHALGT